MHQSSETKEIVSITLNDANNKALSKIQSKGIADGKKRSLSHIITNAVEFALAEGFSAKDLLDE